MPHCYPMPDSDLRSKPLRLASVIPSLTSGGIGAVCQYTAEGMTLNSAWEITLLSLHDPQGQSIDSHSGLRKVCLGLEANSARLFLSWLKANPQDILITSDVSRIEPAFPFLPKKTCHIVQIHDSARRYCDIAVRNHQWINGTTCVGQHIEAPLQSKLSACGYTGLLRTIHNGANFPPPKPRPLHHGPLRLLFMGRVEGLKGVFDFVPILQRLKRCGVPVTLKIVGGENDVLRRQLVRKGLDELVTWVGRIPHAQCYDVAAESDVFLMTSRKESFGMVTLEAMSMGCVPISYDIPSGSTEIIEDGQSGLLVPLGDYKGWASAIETIHRDRKLLFDLSTGAVQRARCCFNAGIMVERMLIFIQDVVQHSERYPAQRISGQPPEQLAGVELKRMGYQRLPEGLRALIRNKICSFPRFSHWLLNR